MGFYRPFAYVVLAAGWVCAQTSDPLEIRGVVVEPPLNLGVAGAQVTLYEFAPDQTKTIPRKAVATTSTDGRGTFRLRAEHYGNYDLDVQKDGYNGGGDTAVSLRRDVPQKELHYSIWRPGELTGRVIDEDNKPVEGIGVVVYDQGEGVDLEPSVFTDKDGIFTAKNLPPRQYLVRIGPKARDLTTVTHFTEDDFKVVDRDFETSFWPGGLDSPQFASGVSVGPGISANLGTIRIRKASYYRLHVSVAEGECGPNESWNFEAFNLSNPASNGARSVFPCMSDFLVRNLSPGSYTLVLNNELTGDRARGTFADMEIASRSTEVTLTMSKGADVSGRVIPADGATLPALDKVHIALETTLGSTTTFTAVAVSADGAFTVRSLTFPRYSVMVQGLSGSHYVKEIRYNGVAVTDRMFTQYLGAPTKVDIVIDDQPAVLTGSVTDGDKPVSHSLVILMKWPISSPVSSIESFELYVRGAIDTDEQGQFRLDGLAPGEYRVLALPEMSLGPRTNVTPHLLTRMLSRAEKVTARAGCVEEYFAEIDGSDPMIRGLPALGPHLFPRCQAALCGLERREAAALLLDQVILNSADGLGRFEDFHPRRSAFAEQHPISFRTARRPILAVDALDPARIRLDPCDRVHPRVQGGTYVELEHELLRRARRQHFHGTRPLGLMIVESRAHPERFQFLHYLRKLIPQRFPAVDSIDAARAGHHDVLAADNLVQLDCLGQSFGGEGRRIVVRGVALDAEIVQQLAHFLGFGGRPPEIRCVKFDHLVTHLRHRAHRARQVFHQLIADRIELQSDRHFARGREGCGR